MLGMMYDMDLKTPKLVLSSLLFDPLSGRSFVLSEEASKSSQTKDTTHSKPEPRRGLKSEKRNLPYWFREGRFEVKPNWTKN